MKDDSALLKHIHDSIVKIQKYTQLGELAFLGDTMVHDAVIRNFEIIGEATKGLSDAVKCKYPEIPWKQIAGMRDFLIHVYFAVKLETIWITIQDDLPNLKMAVERELNIP